MANAFVTNVFNSFTRVATEFKNLRATLGNNANLTTDVKGTLVGAINEINAKPTGGGGGAPVDDSAASQATPYSSSKTESRLSEVAAQTKADLIGGSPADLDTIKEALDFFRAADAENDSATLANTTAIGKRVRFDQAQTLTSGEKAQALANVGAVSIDAIGDTTTDFVAAFEAALA